MAGRSFRPPWWAVLAVVALSGIMISLGVWQLQRGAGKAELAKRYAAASERPPRELTAGAWAEPGEIVRASVRGHFDSNMQMLLDNQSFDGKPGYRVWTPVKTPEGGIVIVDRGWVAANGDRTILPEISAPPQEVEVSGFWRALPVPGMRLDVNNCAGGPWPRIVQYPTPDELRCLYGGWVASGILLMDPDLPGGYVREWNSAPELSPAKHYGYAAQWFAFTATLIGIFIVVNLKRKS